jgi:hypothetical protein
MQRDIVQSAAASAVFVANVFFQWTTAGYFTGDVAQMPLLHLWSLSVEEQFYLAWPALLIALLRFRVRLLPVLATLVLASFLLTTWLMRGHPSAAFYQMPARFWELAAGGMVSAMPARRLPTWTAWAGVALVVAACLVPMAQFPGWGALPAVAGSVLLIAALHGGAGNSLLASGPFVGIGLISYSLYLWHWPLLALDRILRVGVAPLDVRLALVGSAFLLAFISYRYIETPLRRSWSSPRKTLAIGLAVMALLFGTTLTWLHETPALSVANVVFTPQCHPYVEGQMPQMQRPTCLGKESKVVIWGDSFAHSWTQMALTIAEKQHMPATTFALDGCPPLLGADLALRSPNEASDCRNWNDRAVAYMRTHGADTVIITGYWQKFVASSSGAEIGHALARSVQEISPYVRKIVVIAPTPILPDEPVKCAALGSDCAVSRQAFMVEAAPVWAAIRQLEYDKKVVVVDPANWLCGPVFCPGIRNGIALYDDRAHVSRNAVAAYSKLMVKDWK